MRQGERGDPGHGLRAGTGAALAAGLLVLAALTGCETTSTPIDPVLGEESFDGLRRVANARVGEAWIRPDLDLSPYTKILPVSAGVEYRPARSRARTASSSSGGFELSPEARARFEALVNETFVDELGRSQRFALTDEPGPDVLLIEGQLLDVVSFVPPDRVGRSDVFLSQVGQATLVLELRDSESNAILARLADRRAAEAVGTRMTRSNPASNRAEVQRAVRVWATLLRERLDQTPSLTPADD